jgi:hypothetical protein
MNHTENVQMCITGSTGEPDRTRPVVNFTIVLGSGSTDDATSNPFSIENVAVATVVRGDVQLENELYSNFPAGTLILLPDIEEPGIYRAQGTPELLPVDIGMTKKFMKVDSVSTYASPEAMMLALTGDLSQLGPPIGYDLSVGVSWGDVDGKEYVTPRVLQDMITQYFDGCYIGTAKLTPNGVSSATLLEQMALIGITPGA